MSLFYEQLALFAAVAVAASARPQTFEDPDFLRAQAEGLMFDVRRKF